MISKYRKEAAEVINACKEFLTGPQVTDLFFKYAQEANDYYRDKIIIPDPIDIEEYVFTKMTLELERRFNLKSKDIIPLSFDDARKILPSMQETYLPYARSKLKNFMTEKKLSIHNFVSNDPKACDRIKSDRELFLAA